MKNRGLLSLIVILFAGSSALMLSRQADPTLGRFALETEKGNSEAHLTKAQTAAYAAQWRFDRLKDENGNFYPGYVSNALQQADNIHSLSRSNGLGLQWQELGPDNVGGRTRAILIDKRDTTNNTIYAGGVGGGMWKSTDGAVTWNRLTAWNQWLAISCIAQAPAPDYSIYVGTGEGLSQPSGTSYNSGAFGNGVFKLNAIDSPVLVTPTVFNGVLYDPQSGNSPWYLVNRIAVNQTNPNQIIAGTMSGMYQSNDAGATWASVALPNTLVAYKTQLVDDIKWSKDGKNIFAAIGSNVGTNAVIYSNNGGTTWAAQGSTANVGYPAGSNGRIELAIAPSDPNTIYVLVANVSWCTKGVYKSADAGHTWSSVAVGGPLFQLFEEGGGAGCQGWYDNVIAVSPNNPDHFYMGGVNLYTGSATSGVQAADYGYSNESNPYYMHPDKHAIVLADNNPDLMFVGNDGGIFKSVNASSSFPNPTFTSRNRGYNVTENYGIGAGLDGSVIGGAQDNGTNYINYYGNSFGASQQVIGGDGIVNAVSQINTDFYFGGVYFAALARSADHAATFGGMFDVKIDPAGQGGASVCGANAVSGDAQFITPFYLGETKNAVGGVLKAPFTPTDRAYTAGEVVTVTSLTGKYQYTATLAQDVSQDSTELVPDPIRSRLFLATACGAFLTSDALNIAIIPRWFKLTTSLSGEAESFVTTPDANTLYIGTSSGWVYKFSNLNIHADTILYPAGTSVGVLYPASSPDLLKVNVAGGRSIEGIDVDPNDNNHVVAVVAGFSSSATQSHVYESHDGGATWTALPTGLPNGLPNMPVYSVVVHDSHTIIIGTEFGIWSWDGSSWHEENGAFERVPVYRLIERNLYEDGCKVLYLGSHGRGMWRSTTLTPGSCQTAVGTAVNNVKPNAITGLDIFPNPVRNSSKIELNIDNSANVTLRVFDMTGKLNHEVSYHNAPAGKNLYDLDASGLSNGTYLLVATVADTRSLSRLFVVTK